MTPEEKKIYKKKWYEANKVRTLAVQKEHYEANKDEILVKQRAYWHASRTPEKKSAAAIASKKYRVLNPIANLLRSVRHRCKKNNTPMEITETDLILPVVCPVLGIPLKQGDRLHDPNAYSVDRIDNSRGYVPGNVAIISLRANELKKNATLEESVAIAYYQAEHADVLGLMER